jgi:hypothetical protein
VSWGSPLRLGIKPAKSTLDQLPEYFDTLHQPCPTHTNPADHAIDLIAADFERQEDPSDEKTKRVNEYAANWERTAGTQTYDKVASPPDHTSSDTTKVLGHARTPGMPGASLRKAVENTWILLERNLLNYSRNLLAYGVRLGMYCE